MKPEGKIFLGQIATHIFCFAFGPELYFVGALLSICYTALDFHYRSLEVPELQKAKKSLYIAKNPRLSCDYCEGRAEDAEKEVGEKLAVVEQYNVFIAVNLFVCLLFGMLAFG